MTGFLRRLFTPAQPRTPSPRRPVGRPALEALEDRWCPAASISLVFPSPFSGHVVVSGSNLADTVTVTIDDAHNLVTVQARDAFSSTTRSFAASAVSAIDVVGRGGNDSVFCRLASDMTRARHVNLWLGDGDDRAVLDFGLLKSHAISANLGVFVDGGSGNDSVRADFGDVNARNLAFLALMGDGNDRVQANLWGILRGTQAHFGEFGQGGDDFVRFYNDNGSWPSALLDVNLDGGAGNDRVSLFYDDNMIGTHVFNLNGGSGSDLVDAEIHARGGSTGSLTLDIHGGADVDQLRGVLDITPGAPLRVLGARMHVGFPVRPFPVPRTDFVLPGTTPNIRILFDD
jgi:hypothetical protein